MFNNRREKEKYEGAEVTFIEKNLSMNYLIQFFYNDDIKNKSCLKSNRDFMTILQYMSESQENEIQAIDNNLKEIKSKYPGLADKLNTNIKRETLENFQ